MVQKITDEKFTVITFSYLLLSSPSSGWGESQKRQMVEISAGLGPESDYSGKVQKQLYE
jgi:hypothetical protein